MVVVEGQPILSVMTNEDNAVGGGGGALSVLSLYLDC